MITSSVICSEVACCHKWILLFDVVQQDLYDRENCKANLGAVVESVYITLDFMLALHNCSSNYCTDMPSSSPLAKKNHSSVLCTAQAETSLPSPL